MGTNFDFLKQNWPLLLEEAKRVEANTVTDPRTAAWAARRTLELALAWMFDNDSSLRLPHEPKLVAFLHEPTFKKLVPRGLYADLKTIHQQGNLAVHSVTPVPRKVAIQLCVTLFRFSGWLYRVYIDSAYQPAQFNVAYLPKPEKTPEESKEQAQRRVVELNEMREMVDSQDAEQRRTKEKLKVSEDEIAKLKAQLEEIQTQKAANVRNIPAEEYSEAQTRDLFIDGLLREAGWNPKGENVEEYEVQGMPSDSGIGFVDYVLWGADGLPLAVVEVKKTKVDPRVGKRQAELYADCMEKKFKQRPVIFYTNGYNTWLWDDTEYPPREVEGFYTQDELQWVINRRPENKETAKQDLTQLKSNKDIVNRFYHYDAISRVMDKFSTQKKRKALIAMATGMGKTRLSIAIVEILTRGNWSRRVLFLADRKALVRQAKRAFKANLPNYSVKSLVERNKDDVPVNDARVVFSTYPTMLNLIDGTKKDQTDTFSVGHFDLIIIDEAHRSVYQKYGAIFDYFDSLLIGLTATPRDEVDRNTYRLFELENGQPTYAYELDQAVADKFLTPPRAYSVPLKFPREGIKYSELSPEEQEEYELQEQFHDEESGELIEEINAGALNRWLFNEDTVDKVLMHLMEDGLKIEGGDKLGKTIVFAKSEKHARFIVERFDNNYPAYAGKFCQKIDFSVKYAQSLIDDFSIKDKYPQIAVSVDMLDTGIDVPEVLNLVFFKLVRSRTKFWQMVGRGTRLCENLFGPGQHKKEFLIFDYCQNLEFFDGHPKGYESTVQPSLKQKIFNLRLELAYAIQEAKPDGLDVASLATEYKDMMHEIVQGLNVDNFIIRKQRATIEQFVDRTQWNELTDNDIQKIGEKLAGLPSVDDDDETARRFDLIIHNLQVAILRNTNRQALYQKAIREIAENLEDKNSIPMVAAQMELIIELQTDGWWQDITLPMLENVRKKMRELIKFVDAKTQKEDVFTDFEDLLLREDVTEYDIVRADPSLQDYRVRVERIIREHQDHLTIRRLRNNQPVSETDIKALEEILFANEKGVPKSEYENLYGDKPIGLLVRSIVGLNRNAAKQAFAEFLEQEPWHPDQISFLNEIIEYIVKNGTMEPREMFDSPFTRFHDKGVVGVMGEDLAGKVVDLVKRINRNADAA